MLKILFNSLTNKEASKTLQPAQGETKEQT